MGCRGQGWKQRTRDVAAAPVQASDDGDVVQGTRCDGAKQQPDAGHGTEVRPIGLAVAAREAEAPGISLTVVIWKLGLRGERCHPRRRKTLLGEGVGVERSRVRCGLGQV